MHTEIQSQNSQHQDLKSNSESAADVVLRIARNLHRAAYSESKVVSLPILRRLLATATLTAISLPELHRNRDIIQRKHILRMLAVETGFKCWEDYRHELDSMDADQLAHFDHWRRTAGYPNLWFSNYEDAQEYTRENSGHALRIGTQAVVLVG
ncbi:hypothetical protein [Cellvibrio mixtus]|uniref:hypothetical protein n=1 Tax=Cellvibrio mixtus TaxID=39650 RepID=UPI0006942B14|nr:hypothetical protein [Cellvibrio mixtus]